jgi:hypothetical protein
VIFAAMPGSSKILYRALLHVSTQDARLGARAVHIALSATICCLISRSWCGLMPDVRVCIASFSASQDLSSDRCRIYKKAQSHWDCDRAKSDSCTPDAQGNGNYASRSFTNGNANKQRDFFPISGLKIPG